MNPANYLIILPHLSIMIETVILIHYLYLYLYIHFLEIDGIRFIQERIRCGCTTLFDSLWMARRATKGWKLSPKQLWGVDLALICSNCFELN